VLVWEPPNRVVLAWHLNERWQYVPDEARSSEVEIRFSEESPGRTLVELEHRGLERHGDGAEAIREAVSSDGGWSTLLTLFKKAAERS
jgi:uncharacterized protein YndB with AHSA1/START domain